MPVAMRKFVFLLLFLFLLPAVSARVRVTRTEMVDGEFFVGVGNDGSRLKDVSVTVSFSELGQRYGTSSFDIAGGDSTMKRLLLDKLPSGEYYVRITVSNDGFHRTKHRIISIA